MTLGNGLTGVERAALRRTGVGTVADGVLAHADRRRDSSVVLEQQAAVSFALQVVIGSFQCPLGAS
ncbi:hypothetical protein [Streptomyces sp. 4N124]|uniref:hypothetical protein n=1 Tax=Streptomyces sp. 4N124 TaxID=3457420 RepID=UPI003FD3F369